MNFKMFVRFIVAFVLSASAVFLGMLVCCPSLLESFAIMCEKTMTLQAAFGLAIGVYGIFTVFKSLMVKHINGQPFCYGKFTCFGIHVLSTLYVSLIFYKPEIHVCLFTKFPSITATFYVIACVFGIVGFARLFSGQCCVPSQCPDYSEKCTNYGKCNTKNGKHNSSGDLLKKLTTKKKKR